MHVTEISNLGLGITRMGRDGERERERETLLELRQKFRRAALGQQSLDQPGMASTVFFSSQTTSTHDHDARLDRHQNVRSGDGLVSRFHFQI